jgi:hypothetical protein
LTGLCRESHADGWRRLVELSGEEQARLRGIVPNRGLAQLAGYPGTTVAFHGQFQCHLYQMATGRCNQAFACGNPRQIAEMARQALEAGGTAPE